MQPEAVASGFITAVYLRLLSELAAPLGFGDALEQLRRVARGHRMALGLRAPSPSASFQFFSPSSKAIYSARACLVCFC